ncbi:MAG: peptide chain release factor N(5)-glutamine methyltransferase [Marinicaulis sp.]|nr:peptide chain release factor N(5)-glutamine methyltransferase [Marinicaulis sp.]
MTSRAIDEVLRAGAASLTNSDTPMLDARVLMKYSLGLNDAALIARSKEMLVDEAAENFSALIKRRRNEEPVAYIIGEQEFWGLTFKVNERVLIPRPDSECLIEAVLARRPRDGDYKILDLGTGSGCLLCALLSEYQNSDGVGVDISIDALRIAAENSRKMGLDLRAQFVNSDWLSAIDGRWDIVIANPPYISDDDMKALPKSVAKYEPKAALAGGEDGLDPYREIMPQIVGALNASALAVFETGADQTEKLSTIIAKWLPDANRDIIFDLEGRPRAVLADMRTVNKKD